MPRPYRKRALFIFLIFRFFLKTQPYKAKLKNYSNNKTYFLLLPYNKN